jgi:Flp pilus assembly protein TadG
MARSHRRLPKRAQRGAIAVEFALVLPLLAALLMVIITAGLGYNRSLGVGEGVREGARFGATLDSATWSGAVVQQHTIDATALNVSGQPVVVTSAMVCTQLVRAPATVVSSAIGATCGPASNAPANPAGVSAGTCLVKVWARITVSLTFILIPPQDIIVNRQSVSLYERGTC